MKKIAIVFTLFLTVAYSQSLPPSIDVVGEQFYCADAPMPIATDVNITPPSVGVNTWDNVIIQISQGYVMGQDVLFLSGTHPNITASWSITEGQLTLTGPATFEEFEAAILDVLFDTIQADFTTDKFFSINLGNANFLPSTGHYYLYVPSLGIRWTDARDEAASLDYFGLQGYLVTVRTIEEAQLTGEQAPGTGWIGASDAESEGIWRWVTGPENGLAFYNQNTGTPIGGEFNFWNIGEPNDFNGEDYAHITDPTIGELGSWNDLPNLLTNPADPYYPKGYIVEFGGMPGDDTSLSLSGSSRIITPKVQYNEVSVCEGDEVDISVSSNVDTLIWYETATASESIFTGSTITVIVDEAVTYWVEPLFQGCNEGNRLPIAIQTLDLPEANDILISQCSTNVANETAEFNLSEYIENITGGITENREVNFYSDANLTLPINSESYTSMFNNQIVYAQVINTLTSCVNISEVTLQLSALVQLNPAYIEACDSVDEDGITTFDLSMAENQIFDAIPVGFDFLYFETYEDALSGINQLPNDYTNIEPYNQTIIARIEASGSCYGITEVFLNVAPLPNTDLIEVVWYCLNTYPETITLTGGIQEDSPSNYYYSWSTGETTSTIEINEPGIYTVNVTSVAGCTKLRTVTVSASGTATVEDVSVVDLSSDNNTITVLVSGEGEYEYSIDNSNYQTSNVFENLQAGVYTVYIKDIENDCGITAQEVFVVGYPKFFTPNDDTFNDVWRLKGISQEARQFVSVKIYDRFGKLLKTLWSSNDFWDGTYNGNAMPSSDYWFVATLEDGRTFTGHFSLRL
ncbi:T9SS type B sorting domain-containing protein [Winogradskyella sp. 3972H.M.0a.05]|uniref:T9SS type B sorting domain-containing protein n=1 Tax=Winogradskyella sp. 3972H.M.0a.05 TaxID=2950277 RepID=UPI003396F47B